MPNLEIKYPEKSSKYSKAMDSKSGFKKLMTILKTNFSPAFNITRLNRIIN